MNLFDKFRGQPRSVDDAEHLQKYLEITNGRDIRGQFVHLGLEVVLGNDGEVAYEDEITSAPIQGHYIHVPTSESREPSRTYFVRSDGGDIVETGRPAPAILVAEEGQLMVDAASILVHARREVPAPRQSSEIA